MKFVGIDSRFTIHVPIEDRLQSSKTITIDVAAKCNFKGDLGLNA